MKKTLIIFSSLILGVSSVLAQEGDAQEEYRTPIVTERGVPDSDIDQSEREQVEIEELPEAITTALANGVYSKMKVTEVYSIKEEGVGSKTFDVYLQSKDGQYTIVKYDEKGKLVESK